MPIRILIVHRPTYLIVLDHIVECGKEPYTLSLMNYLPSGVKPECYDQYEMIIRDELLEEQ